jgi:hypothetical protein
MLSSTSSRATGGAGDEGDATPALEGLDGGAGRSGATLEPSMNALLRATREQKRAALRRRALDLDYDE